MTQHHLNPPSFLGESAMKVSGIAHRSSSTPKILADLEQDGSDQSPDLREQVGNSERQGLTRRRIISAELRKQTEQTCEQLDEIIKQKKLLEIENKKLKRSLIDGGQCSFEDDRYLDNPLTSSIEKKRRRVVNEFQIKIRKKKQMLEEINYYIQQNIPRDIKANQVLSCLSGKDRDPDVNQAYTEIQPQTALFLADLIKDAMDQTQKNRSLQQLSRELRRLVDQRNQFDKKMRKRMTRITCDGIMEILRKGVGDLNKQAVDYVIQKNDLSDQKQFLYNINSEIVMGQSNSGNLVQKPFKFQNMVKKNFGSIVATRIDIMYMTRTLTMIQLLENIFKEQNIGTFYSQMSRTNLWINDFLRENDLDISFTQNQKNIHDLNLLYQTEVTTLEFYKDAKDKKEHLLEEHQTVQIANLQFKRMLEKGYQPSLPTFAKMKNHELFLNEIVITNEMAQGLADYIKVTKKFPDKIVKGLIIENCNMRDDQLAVILQGINEQGQNLKTFVYSNGEFCNLASKQLLCQIQNIRNLHLNKLTKNFSKIVIMDILRELCKNGQDLMKLRLSRINLCDNDLIQILCELIENRIMLQHLHLQWAKLQPKHLNSIVKSFLTLEKPLIKNLNVSYNSLIQNHIENDLFGSHEHSEQQASCEFVSNLCELIQRAIYLNHLDVSGMNFCHTQLLKIAETAIQQDECLSAVHLNDNGIRFDTEIRDEIIDMMGLNKSIFDILNDAQFQINQRILFPENIRKIIRRYNMSLNSKDFENFAHSDANIYTNRMLQSKIGKSVITQKNKHKVQISGGVGRLDSSLIDQFILGRRVNNPELIFNQQPYIDKYFEIDAAQSWKLFDGSSGMTGGCQICNRHRYTMIFYEQDLEDPWSHNEGLIEIKDADVIEQIRKDLNISYRYTNDIAPFIVGTIVQGGFKRKLKMVRADYFSMLSISQSIHTVTDLHQTKQIKRGIMANILKTQKLGDQDPQVDLMMGWQKKLIIDKCLNNEVEDVCLINFPNDLRGKPQATGALSTLDDIDGSSKQTVESPGRRGDASLQNLPADKPCTTFIYATYLYPGQHQFLLFCPKTKRAYVKDIVIGLSECDPFPEFPEKYQPPTKPKKPTRQNVWRHWKNDTDESNKMAFITDMQRPEDYQYLKDENELKECYKIISKNFTMLQIVFMELIAQSPHFYPKIPFENLIKQIVDSQNTDEERKGLQRSQVELSFIGATKLDSTKGVSGTLTRGQFFEIIIRLTKQRYPQEKQVSKNLEEFIETYCKPLFDNSKILPIRNTIRESKQLNQLLFDNKQGLYELFIDYREYPRGFTYLAATKLLNPLDEDAFDGAQLIPEMQRVFFISKMTNLKDKEQQQIYHHLVYVEFLDFICRVGIELWKKDQMEDGADVHIKVYYLLRKMWARRTKYPEEVPLRPLKKGEVKIEEWPDLIPVMVLDSDDD